MPATADALPLVTVAILAYDRKEQLAVNLRKVHDELDYPNDRLEVIVVDNASTDGTAEMVRRDFPWAELIVSETNTGIGGWNLAFERGRGDWFLVLDDDCYMEGDSLRRALAAARDARADLVSFAVHSSVPGESFSEWYRTGLLLFWGCSALVSRRALERIGGFDERMFIYAHETEWTMRFLDAGFAHLHLPEVRSVHMKPLPPAREVAHTQNVKNFGYMVGKLMHPTDVPVTFLRILSRTILLTLHQSTYHPAIPAVFKGLWAGLKVREPVGREVSRLYRRHYLEFNSWLLPRERYRFKTGRADGSPTMFHLYWDARQRQYPEGAATIQLR